MSKILTKNSAGTSPSARYCHRAVNWGECMIIFGGFDGRVRLNDVHFLDLSTMSWSQPEVKGDVPTARSHHACSLYGNSVVIHGGAYARACVRLTRDRAHDNRSDSKRHLRARFGIHDMESTTCARHATVTTTLTHDLCSGQQAGERTHAAKIHTDFFLHSICLAAIKGAIVSTNFTFSTSPQ
jgi:hypothetical protein